jgi:ABC-type spermidine/putrescine transport systems, ATPase components
MLDLNVEGQIGARQLRVRLQANGKPVALIGPNGAGKTSLLLMVLGVIQPSSGRIALGERVLFDSVQGATIPPEERGVGYLPQSYALFPHMTVRENVVFGIACRRPRLSRGERREHALRLLNELGIAELTERMPDSLSGGEKQRVALARALAAEPHVLLLDEPLAALDSTIRRRTRGFLAAYLRALGLPAIVVTHDPEDVRALGSRVLVLEEGQVVQQGTVEELSLAPATRFVNDFFATVRDTPTDQSMGFSGVVPSPGYRHVE